MVTDIYRIKTQNSIYEIQVSDTGASRCHKVSKDGEAVDGPWHLVRSDSSTYLEKLAVGPSFDVPGVVLTSRVKDYRHFVLSDEPKRVVHPSPTLGDAMAVIAGHIAAQANGMKVRPRKPRVRVRQNKLECSGHKTTAQGREHRLLIDGHVKWVNEHAGARDMELLRDSGCSLVPA